MPRTTYARASLDSLTFEPKVAIMGFTTKRFCNAVGGGFHYRAVTEMVSVTHFDTEAEAAAAEAAHNGETARRALRIKARAEAEERAVKLTVAGLS